MNEDEMLAQFLAEGFLLLPCFSINEDGSCTCGYPHNRSQNDLASRGKHPVIHEWQKAASNDPNQIEQWRAQHPRINWAVFCKGSGLMVTDIDPRNGGERSLYRLECDFAEIMPKTYQVRTGAYNMGYRSARGEHRYFRVPENAKIKGALGKEMRGIDLKWNGYVLLPGSRHLSGVNYELTEDSLPISEIADLPPEMLEAFSKPSTRKASSYSQFTLSPRATPYGATALKQEVAEIASMPEGNRNNSLFEKGIKISELIAGGELPPSAIGNVADAARQSGLSDEEIERVLFREGGAFQIGLSQPRSSGSRTTDGDQSINRGDSDSWQEEFLHKNEPVNWEEAFQIEWEEDWFAPGFVARGRSHAIYSEPGIGKSVVTRQLCAELCSGGVVLGTRPYAEPVKVLFFDHENTIVQDVVPQLRQLGYTPEQLKNLVYLSFPEMSELDTIEGGKQFEALLDLHRPDLVVLDTVSRTISQDENQNQTWLDFYRYAGVQLKNRGIAYIRLDHAGKNVERGMRGGSAKKGDLDLVWLLSEGNKPGRFILTCEKSRIPLETKRLELERSFDPLRHKLVMPTTKIDWAELFFPLEKWLWLFEFLSRVKADNGKLIGSGAIWKSYRDEFQKRKVTRKLLETAHKDFRAGRGALDH